MQPQNPQDQNATNQSPNPQTTPPVVPAAAPTPQVVYITRPMDPEKQQISPEALRRHEESIKKYPNINLSKGEYIVSAVKRHPIGLIQIWVGVIAIIALMIGLVALFVINPGDTTSGFDSSAGSSGSASILTIVLLLVSVMALIGGIVGTFVYQANSFFLTNESVIQNIQTSLFSKREQTVSLENVEDVSYLQTGILPHILNYGSIRLSTEGEETTYRFNYVGRPKHQVSILNNAVEAFKNGRPVED